MTCGESICAAALPTRASAAARASPWSLRPCITSAVPTCSSKSLRKCYFPVRMQPAYRRQVLGSPFGPNSWNGTRPNSFCYTFAFAPAIFRHWPAASPTRKSMAIQKVGVAGCGLMGSGIAQACAMVGFTTVVREVNQDLLDKGLKEIEKNLGRLVEKGTITEAAKGEIRGRLKGTTGIEHLKDCDLIIEAIIENLPAKHELFRVLDEICAKQTIFASNTSSLTITEIATATKRPQRFVGLHFFNPVPVMKLVEVVKTIATDPAVYEEMVAFGAKLGKTPVRANDSTGFIVNRLLLPYLLDAIRALEEV